MLKNTPASNRNRPLSGLLIIHHSGASPDQTFESIDNYHKGLWNFESSIGHFCGYHYLIDKQGVVHQARLDTDEGAHTLGQNRHSLGVCLTGDFDVDLPTPEQITSLTELVIQKMITWNIPIDNILPHRHFTKKTCYGGRLADTWAQDLVVHYKGNRFGKLTDISEFECPV